MFSTGVGHVASVPLHSCAGSTEQFIGPPLAKSLQILGYPGRPTILSVDMFGTTFFATRGFSATKNESRTEATLS